MSLLIAGGSLRRLREVCESKRLSIPSSSKRDPPVEGSFGNTGLLCSLGHGASEQDQRVYHLVVLLLGPQEQRHQRFPLVGRFDAASVGPLRARTLPPSLHHVVVCRRRRSMPPIAICGQLRTGSEALAHPSWML